MKINGIGYQSHIGFKLISNNVILKNNKYDFISKKFCGNMHDFLVEDINQLKEYQLVALSICYYSGLPFKSGKWYIYLKKCGFIYDVKC